MATLEGYTPEDIDVLRLTSTVGSIASVSIGSLVLFTILTYERKRKFPGNLYWWIMLASWCNALLLLAPEFLGGHDAVGADRMYCTIQGFGLMYFTLAMVAWWFSITVNLYMVLVNGRDTAPIKALFKMMCWGLPAIAGGLYYLLAEVTYQDVYCFLSPAPEHMVYGMVLFYAPIALMTVIGMMLWARTMWQSYQLFKLMSKDENFREYANIAGFGSFMVRYPRYFIFVIAMFAMFGFLPFRQIIVLTGASPLIFAFFAVAALSTAAFWTAMLMGVTYQNMFFWLSCCGTLRVSQSYYRVEGDQMVEGQYDDPAWRDTYKPSKTSDGKLLLPTYDDEDQFYATYMTQRESWRPPVEVEQAPQGQQLFMAPPPKSKGGMAFYETYQTMRDEGNIDFEQLRSMKKSPHSPPPQMDDAVSSGFSAGGYTDDGQSVRTTTTKGSKSGKGFGLFSAFKRGDPAPPPSVDAPPPPPSASTKANGVGGGADDNYKTVHLGGGAPASGTNMLFSPEKAAEAAYQANTIFVPRDAPDEYDAVEDQQTPVDEFAGQADKVSVGRSSAGRRKKSSATTDSKKRRAPTTGSGSKGSRKGSKGRKAPAAAGSKGSRKGTNASAGGSKGRRGPGSGGNSGSKGSRRGGAGGGSAKGSARKGSQGRRADEKTSAGRRSAGRRNGSNRKKQ